MNRASALWLVCQISRKHLDEHTIIAVSSASKWFRKRLFTPEMDERWRENHDRALCIGWLWEIRNLDEDCRFIVHCNYPFLWQAAMQLNMLGETMDLHHLFDARNLSKQHELFQRAIDREYGELNRFDQDYSNMLREERRAEQLHHIPLDNDDEDYFDAYPRLDYSDDDYDYVDRSFNRPSCACFLCRPFDVDRVRCEILQFQAAAYHDGLAWTIHSDFSVFIYQMIEETCELDYAEELALLHPEGLDF